MGFFLVSSGKKSYLCIEIKNDDTMTALEKFLKSEEKRRQAAIQGDNDWLEFITYVATRLRKKCINTPILCGNYVYLAAKDEHLDNRLVVVCCHVIDYLRVGMSAMFPIYNPHAENDDYGWDKENSIKIYTMLYKDVLNTPIYMYRSFGVVYPMYIKD